MTDESNLKEEVKKLRESVQVMTSKRKKKFRIPFRARTTKRQVRNNYIIVEKIDENKNVSFVKTPIIDGVYKLGDDYGGTHHAIKESDIFYHKSKPFVHQAKSKLNPYNPLAGSHETFGQRYIIAKMKSDVIKGAKKKISGGLIFGLIIAAIIAYYFFSSGGAG